MMVASVKADIEAIANYKQCIAVNPDTAEGYGGPALAT
jgi:hypothetical protein